MAARAAANSAALSGVSCSASVGSVLLPSGSLMSVQSETLR